ncbi:hypothetical protein BaRGS_00005172 [Batillaria attramentaria]|uniref:Ig-like domain-containing protein n=1 Tax=Batillaria attramentaria TaxID=370345 RepID=A0ABD0LW64_9CAEN
MAACLAVLVSSFLVVTKGQLNFGTDDGFQLTASKNFFRPGDDVTFVCRGRTTPTNDGVPRNLVFPDSKGITWERNGQPLFSTQKEGEKCRVQAETLLGRPAVTPRDLEAVTCVQDDASVTVTIRNITVTPGGDRWLCSQFPFRESNAVLLANYEDHFPNDVNTRVLMTLRCQASPSNPAPAITWRILRDGKPLPLPDQSRLHSQTDGYGRVTMVSELALGADPRYEGAVVTCRATNWKDNDVTSKQVVLTVKRAPRMLLTARPSNDVIEGTDVTLSCTAHGYPQPEVRWKKEGGYLPGGLGQADTPVLSLTPARIPDKGEYICTASNGVSPDAVNSIYLKVETPSSSTAKFPRVENGSMTAPRPGVYASRSSMRPVVANGSLSMDYIPQYLELPPAPSPPVGIINRGYGLSSKHIGAAGRPLPAAPVAYDESRNTCDSGYDEIRDVTPEAGRMASPDGYEVPVLHEEEEEECIYDVARPDWSGVSQRQRSSKRAMYMNEDTFSTQL